MMRRAAAKANALGPLAARISFDPQPFHELLELKNQASRPAKAAMDSLFGRYLASIRK